MKSGNAYSTPPAGNKPASAVSALIVLFLLFCGSLVLDPDPGKNDVVLYAVGDVMLGPKIRTIMAERGSDYPFHRVSSFLKSGDIVFGNLESVIGEADIEPLYPEKKFNFRAPVSSADALARAGFHVLSLANNHAMDFGPELLSGTRRLLNENGIAVFGAGNNSRQARGPAIITRKDTRFGFLGYGISHPHTVYAGENEPGIAAYSLADIKSDIDALRPHVDVLVVSLHWGTEFENAPSGNQVMDAHRIIDWGADLILGHHPHVMQGIERYKVGIIAYSLGNFVFDYVSHGQDRSFILSCRFRNRKLSSVNVIPLDRFDVYIPDIARGRAKKNIAKQLDDLSVPLNNGDASSYLN